jgi:hypothetical protein
MLLHCKETYETFRNASTRELPVERVNENTIGRHSIS